MQWWPVDQVFFLWFETLWLSLGSVMCGLLVNTTALLIGCSWCNVVHWCSMLGCDYGESMFWQCCKSTMLVGKYLMQDTIQYECTCFYHIVNDDELSSCQPFSYCWLLLRYFIGLLQQAGLGDECKMNHDELHDCSNFPLLGYLHGVLQHFGLLQGMSW